MERSKKRESVRVRVWRRKKEGKKKGKKKERNAVRVWRIKKEGKKRKKKRRKEREMVLQYFHNTFTINFKW